MGFEKTNIHTHLHAVASVVCCSCLTPTLSSRVITCQLIVQFSGCSKQREVTVKEEPADYKDINTVEILHESGTALFCPYLSFNNTGALRYPSCE